VWPPALASGMRRPHPGDHASDFQRYIDRVPDGDIVQLLQRQAPITRQRIAAIDEARGSYAYAPGKWSVKRLLQHLVDGERLFCYRALCIARGDQCNLPAFDENAYAKLDGSDGRRLADIGSEYAAVREATVQLCRGFDAAAWERRGTANGHPVAVRSLPWIIAGHELHHLAVLGERYGV
jgi:uncharacterized damage-inducible protein DinB